MQTTGVNGASGIILMLYQIEISSQGLGHSQVYGGQHWVIIAWPLIEHHQEVCKEVCHTVHQEVLQEVSQEDLLEDDLELSELLEHLEEQASLDELTVEEELLILVQSQV
jgi:hypothetical protein